MKRQMLTLLIVMTLSQGCVYTRYTAIPQVEDKGAEITTRFRYRLEEYRPPKKLNYSKASRGRLTGDLRKTMEREFPGVFSPEGIPFNVSRLESCVSQGDVGTGILGGLISFLSLSAIPRVLHQYRDTAFQIDLSEDDTLYAKADVKYMVDTVSSLLPLAMLYFNGVPEVSPGARYWYERQYGPGATMYEHSGFDPNLQSDSDRKALAYAVSVRLKELEDAGALDNPDVDSPDAIVTEHDAAEVQDDVDTETSHDSRSHENAWF